MGEYHKSRPRKHWDWCNVCSQTRPQGPGHQAGLQQIDRHSPGQEQLEDVAACLLYFICLNIHMKMPKSLVFTV